MSLMSRAAEVVTRHNVSVALTSGEPLEVRTFSVKDHISTPFVIDLEVVSETSDVDFEAAIGAPARFQIEADGGRFWEGVCAFVEQTAVDEKGLSTYVVRIVPSLWLLGHRSTYRIFQDMSELDIVLRVLGEWGIEPMLELDAARYPKRRYRTQYGETDLALISRLLEDIGVSYYFAQVDDATRLVLADAPNHRSADIVLPFVDKPNERVVERYVTEVRTRREVRPGRFTQSDVDYRKPLDYPLAASSARGTAIEGRLERYQHEYGSFLWKGQGGDTPHADDRGAARTNEREAAVQVKRRLEALRGDGRVCSFATSDFRLRPGEVMRIVGHPRDEVGAAILVVGCHFKGEARGNWDLRCEARFADVDYRPPLATPRPTTRGVESATVTGPGGEEIHTDEFGRVRVHFHWDREGASDETSSCWIPVNQPWAGAGFGSVNIPRVGQEVLVDFLGADPDRPVVVGRVFTTTNPPPYKLPDLKMVGGMRSNSYPSAKRKIVPRMGGETEPEDDERGGDGASSGGTTPAVLAGMPAAVENFNDMVAQVGSAGPDPSEHGLPANAVTMDDTAGSEKLYLQGQKDVRINAKENFTGAVGGNRSFSVWLDDGESIGGKQTTEVVKDRTIAVTEGNQYHGVQGDIITQGLSNLFTQIKQSLSVITLEGSQVYAAKTGFVATVNGTATIYMDPTAIVIDAPHVYINPGAKVMEQIFAGKTAEQAVADVESEERVEAAATAEAAKLQAIDGLNGQTYLTQLEMVANGLCPGQDVIEKSRIQVQPNAPGVSRGHGPGPQPANVLQDFLDAGLTPEEAQAAAERAQQLLEDNPAVCEDETP